jgi:hypothetical protein
VAEEAYSLLRTKTMKPGKRRWKLIFVSSIDNEVESCIEHHSICVHSSENKRPKSPPPKEYKVTFEAEHEKLQVLKDENIHLKNKKREMEDSVKQ